MGDESIAPTTQKTKAIALLLIPLVIALVVRWLIFIANWVVIQSDYFTTKKTTKLDVSVDIIEKGIKQQKQQQQQQQEEELWPQFTEQSNTTSLTASYLRGLLEATQVEDGLLTRADFLELTLLAMKKIDLQLLMTLREGYDQVTQAGSVDLTRKKFTDSAANAINHPQHRWRMKKVRQEQKRYLREHEVNGKDDESSSYLLVMDWLLGRGNTSCDIDRVSFLV